MKSLRSLWTVALLVCWAGSAQAWSIGTNGGVSVLMPKGGGDSFTTIGVPGGGGFVTLAFQPGLRLGSVSESGNDFHVDLGLASAFGSGSSITSFQGSVNYQRSFAPTADSSPFVTVGVGGLVLSGDSETFSNAVIGGGLGVRKLVSQGHGAVRGEFRVDYITEDSQGFVGGTEIGVKLGFDLLMK